MAEPCYVRVLLEKAVDDSSLHAFAFAVNYAKGENAFSQTYGDIFQDHILRLFRSEEMQVEGTVDRIFCWFVFVRHLSVRVRNVYIYGRDSVKSLD